MNTTTDRALSAQLADLSNDFLRLIDDIRPRVAEIRGGCGIEQTETEYVRKQLHDKLCCCYVSPSGELDPVISTWIDVETEMLPCCVELPVDIRGRRWRFRCTLCTRLKDKEWRTDRAEYDVEVL